MDEPTFKHNYKIKYRTYFGCETQQGLRFFVSDSLCADAKEDAVVSPEAIATGKAEYVSLNTLRFLFRSAKKIRGIFRMWLVCKLGVDDKEVRSRGVEPRSSVIVGSQRDAVGSEIQKQSMTADAAHSLTHK